jgi:hypothetical protein
MAPLADREVPPLQVLRPQPLRQRREEGSVALSRCTTAHPLHTGFANIFDASVSEATLRPNPRQEPLASVPVAAAPGHAAPGHAE